MDGLKKIHVESWFYAFLVFHVAIWALVPATIRHNLPLDAMEGTTWGEHFAWGYDKNPFMTAWLTAVALAVGPSSGVSIYILSQLAVTVCFWSVWRLGKYMLPPIYALVAVFSLEGIQYYNLHTIDFADNTLELATWSLTILFFYQALLHNKLMSWVFVGFFAGLSMMTKYYSIVLLIPMMLYILMNNDGRKQLKNPNLYLSLVIFFIIISPHISWLLSNNFITFNYAVSRVTLKSHSGFNHIYHSLKFVLEQFVTLLPTLLLLSIFLIKKKAKESAIVLTTFHKQFLFFTAIGPLLLTVLLSMLLGMRLRAAWGQPLFSLWVILFIFWFKPVITIKRFYRFMSVLTFMVIMTAIIYSINIIRGLKPSSANFPGKMIATTLTNIWEQRYHTPLNYVAGGRWLAGNISFYAKTHPQVYIDWNHQMSPWIDEDKMNIEGAIFVWDLSAINRREEPPLKEIKNKFPTLTPIEVMYFPWHHNSKLLPIKINVAFLPPKNSVLEK